MAVDTRSRKIVLGLVIVILIGAAAFALTWDTDPPPEPLLTGVAEIADVRPVLRETGVIRPYREVVVTSGVSGRLVRLEAREGERVRAGEVVARIEPDLNQAQLVAQVRSAYEAGRLRLEVAETEHERARRMVEAGVLTEQALGDRTADRDAARIQLEATEQQFRLMRESGVLDGADAGILSVVSPASGVVIQRGVEEGEAVQAGTGVFGGGTAIITVAELDRLKIESEVNEIDIGMIEIGRPATITLDAYPGAEFQGRVTHVSPAARDRGGVRVFDVEVEVEGSDLRLRPGMTANLDILGPRREGVLTVPIEAVFRVEGRDVAYRMEGEQPVAVPVSLGLSDTERVEILAGLEPGDRIAREDPAIARERQSPR